MSASRETIASVCRVDADEVNCQKCKYGDGGELLVRCGNPFYEDVVVASGSFCSFWAAKAWANEWNRGEDDA